MKAIFKITYLIDNEDATDEEFENQDEKEFIITESMIQDLIDDNISYNRQKETIQISNITKL